MIDRYVASDPLARQKNDVLERMHGCSDPACIACADNKKAIDVLVAAVTRVTSGSRVGA